MSHRLAAVLLAAVLLAAALLAGPAMPAARPLPTVSSSRLPGTPSGLVMLSDQNALLAANDQLYGSSDGGRTWAAAFPHCAQAQMADQPCGYAFRLVRLGTHIVLAGVPGATPQTASASLWRSLDGGRTWQRATLLRPAALGPWTAGATAYVLLQPAPNARTATLERSTDGATWTSAGSIPLSDPAAAGHAWFLRGVAVLGPGAWVAAYGAGDCSIPSGLALTRDGGGHWHAQAPPLYEAATAPVPATADRWYLAGSCTAAAPTLAQGLFTTADAGASWRPVSLRAGYGPLRPSQVFFAASPGRTVSGKGYAVDLGAVEAIDAHDAIAVGGYRTYDASNGFSTSATLGSIVLASSDDGSTWTLDALPGLPNLNLVSCAAPGSCLAASTQASTLVRLGPAPASPSGLAIFDPAIPTPPTVRPTRIQLDNHDYLDGLHWTTWTSSGARARGSLLLNTCTPDCAAGHYRAYPVEVVANDVRNCTVHTLGGARLVAVTGSFYNRVRFSYRGVRPASPFPTSLPAACSGRRRSD